MFDSEIYNTKFPISVQTTFKPSTSEIYLYSLIINFTYTILYFNFMYMVTHKNESLKPVFSNQKNDPIVQIIESPCFIVDLHSPSCQSFLQHVLGSALEKGSPMNIRECQIVSSMSGTK